MYVSDGRPLNPRSSFDHRPHIFVVCKCCSCFLLLHPQQLRFLLFFILFDAREEVSELGKDAIYGIELVWSCWDWIWDGQLGWPSEHSTK